MQCKKRSDGYTSVNSQQPTPSAPPPVLPNSGGGSGGAAGGVMVAQSVVPGVAAAGAAKTESVISYPLPPFNGGTVVGGPNGDATTLSYLPTEHAASATLINLLSNGTLKHATL